MHGHRHTFAMAAAGALCAALAGCASQQTSVSSIATAASAASAAGQWTALQKTDAQAALEGPPIGESEHQATCMVRIAETTVSWDDFQNYVQFLQQQQITVPPKVISGLANAAGDVCGK